MSERVLVVDDDAEMAAVVARHLEGEGMAAASATSGEQALAAVEHEPFAVVVTDVVMTDVGGLDLLRAVQRTQPEARVILMTAFGSLETAIEAIRGGAYDYLTKPFTMAELTLTVRRALDERRLRAENRRLRAEVERRYAFDALVARSLAMRHLVGQLEGVADSDATLLLLGESGAGKEVVARAVHWNSPRRERPFVAINCAAIPEPLLESEMFGHERGAFTGAVQRRRGLFAEADGGTLFLDEIADMPPSLQAKLLRALQDKVVRPVGGRDEVRVDVRIISATNRDLIDLVQRGRFREDLYYRLAVIPLRVPSLRERTEDVLALAHQFLRRTSANLGKTLDGFTDEAAAWLRDHRWPGNVRQLENVVERAATLARGERIALADLRVDIGAPRPASGGVRPTLAELEDEYIRRILAETGGDKRAAARILGVSVRTLQRRSPSSTLPEAS